MKTNLYILRDKLSKHYQTQESGYWQKKLTLPRPLLISGSVLTSDCLYLCDASDLFEDLVFEDRVSVICTGVPPEDIIPEHVALLLIDSCEFTQVFNEVNAIYGELERWSNQLYEELYGDCSIQRMLDASREIFGNGIAIMGNQYTILYETSDSRRILNKRLFPSHEHNDKSLPQEVIKHFRNDEYYKKVMHKREVFIYPKGIYECRTLCSNIFLEEAFIARITIAELDGDFNESDAMLLQFLSSVVAKAFARDSIRALKQERPLKDLLRASMIENRPMVDNPYTYAGDYCWVEGGTFVCLSIQMGGDEKENLMLEKICTQAEGQFKGACALVLEESIVVILSIEQLGQQGYGMESLVQAFLDWNGFVAGMSRKFSDLYQVHAYYRQAARALAIGVKTNKGEKLHTMEQLLSEYICDRCTEDFDAEVLCNWQLMQLKKHDEQNQTQLYKTLRAYLDSSMSPTKCARSMYVHRATLLHRLERIEQLTGLDLSDREVRFDLEVSFRLLERST